MLQTTIEAVIGRVERMNDRFMNAGISISVESERTIQNIRSCGTVGEALAKERELIDYCNATYPLDRNKILATLNFYQQLYRHEDFMAIHNVKC